MFKLDPITYHLKYQKCELNCPIQDGEKVLITTLDAHAVSPGGTHYKGFSNPLTGPFVLPEAQPGDLLADEQEVSVDAQLQSFQEMVEFYLDGQFRANLP